MELQVPVADHEPSGRSAAPAPGRPWVLIIASLLLAALAAWMGVQYKRSLEREQRLRTELRQVYLEAGNLRSEIIRWRERAMFLQQQASALTVERDGLAEQLGALEAELAALKARRGSRAPAPR